MKQIVYVYGEKYKHLVSECLKLDAKVYEPKYVGNKDVYEKAYTNNCENFIFAIDVESGKLAGYLMITPLEEETYREMRKGNSIDTTFIKIDNIIPLRKDEDNYMYIYSLVVNPEYQGMGISKKLADKLFDNLQVLNEEYKINAVLGDTINPKAFGNMLRYGYIPVGVTNHQSVLIEKVFVEQADESQEAQNKKIVV